MELNKIFAAVLVAGIVAMLSGFIAELLTEPRELEKDAVTIEGAAVAGGGPAAEAGGQVWTSFVPANVVSRHPGGTGCSSPDALSRRLRKTG